MYSRCFCLWFDFCWVKSAPEITLVLFCLLRRPPCCLCSWCGKWHHYDSLIITDTTIAHAVIRRHCFLCPALLWNLWLNIMVTWWSFFGRLMFINLHVLEYEQNHCLLETWWNLFCLAEKTFTHSFSERCWMCWCDAAPVSSESLRKQKSNPAPCQVNKKQHNKVKNWKKKFVLSRK